jgi:hypothetical protein
VADAYDHEAPDNSSENNSGVNPFAGLGDLLKGKPPE